MSNRVTWFTAHDRRTIISMPTASLPRALRELVKRIGYRPSTVEITLSVNPAAINTNYRTGKIVSLGELLATIDTTRTGSDGETNPSKALIYSAPTVVAVPECGSRTKNGVRISVGGLAPFVELLEGDEPITAYRLECMVEYALGEQL